MVAPGPRPALLNLFVSPVSLSFFAVVSASFLASWSALFLSARRFVEENSATSHRNMPGHLTVDE